jgi:hypothetical protein
MQQTTYTLTVLHEDDEETVHLACGADGPALHALAEEIVRHAAPAVSCVKVRAEGPRGPKATLLWWRGMRLV